jgi:hypothetical protein
MPLVVDALGKQHRSHRFEGTSRAMLSRALHVSVSAARIGNEVELTFSLRARAAHAVPTGDLFRRLEIEVRNGDKRASAILARTFGTVLGRDDEGHEGYIRRDQRDLRVLPGVTRVVRLRVVATPGAELAWSISHLRTMPELAPEPAGNRTVFLEGRITPP